MRRLIPSMTLFLLGMAAAPAAGQEWRPAPEYDVLLTNYDIMPRELRLKAGQPVRLHFVNNSNQALTFSAEAFFRNARLRDRDSSLVKGGAIHVAPLSERTVALVPKAGRYAARSRNFIHRLLGMSGRIIVE